MNIDVTIFFVCGHPYIRTQRLHIFGKFDFKQSKVDYSIFAPVLSYNNFLSTQTFNVLCGDFLCSLIFFFPGLFRTLKVKTMGLLRFLFYMLSGERNRGVYVCEVAHHRFYNNGLVLPDNLLI